MLKCNNNIQVVSILDFMRFAREESILYFMELLGQLTNQLTSSRSRKKVDYILSLLIDQYEAQLTFLFVLLFEVMFWFRSMHG